MRAARAAPPPPRARGVNRVEMRPAPRVVRECRVGASRIGAELARAVTVRFKHENTNMKTLPLTGPQYVNGTTILYAVMWYHALTTTTGRGGGGTRRHFRARVATSERIRRRERRERYPLRARASPHARDRRRA